MALNEEQTKWMQELLDMAENAMQKLNDFEVQFIESTKERWEQYGSNMFLSPKQKAVLDKIEEKLR